MHCTRRRGVVGDVEVGLHLDMRHLAAFSRLDRRIRRASSSVGAASPPRWPATGPGPSTPQCLRFDIGGFFDLDGVAA